jgi:zinc transport system substrate-binding protein
MDEHDDHITEDAAENDYHVWLDPNNTIAMMKLIRDQLIKIDPQNAGQYTENAQQLIDATIEKDQSIRKQLSGITERPFIVMHDAWQYFSKHYQLNQLSSVTMQEDLRASAKAISEAREMIRNSGVACVVTEPNFRLDTVKVLTEDFDVNTAQIDPLGRDIAIGRQSYPELLQNTADKLLSCLQKNNAL